MAVYELAKKNVGGQPFPNPDFGTLVSYSSTIYSKTTTSDICAAWYSALYCNNWVYYSSVAKKMLDLLDAIVIKYSQVNDEHMFQQVK